MSKEKKAYEKARLRVVQLSGKSQLLAGSDTGGASGGGNNPNYSPAAGVTLSAMGAEGSLQ